MRLTEGIVVDSVLTFGKLRFSALRREVRKQNEDGTVSNEVKERTYNLKSSAQGRMIQVSISANVPLREFAYDAEVELVNPIVDTVANYVFREGTTVNWFIKADDLVLKRQPNQGNSTNQIEGKK
ncbi:TPA: YdcP family protein [Enterococcus faecalis]|nr:YdcP family protein [Enterococcus faecalis]HBI1659788.1 YdcP family protein [Enterococcus faecalis]HBI1665704.1 YdcP family protein [Enterococcus faecalis]HBI1668738.1 YdcP family protein [Enterococcus faecalis]HBI1671877.1 YdcP family protein [Enterococcus faecalis]